jgi:iron(III) transport system ATP-binding protein
MSNQLVVEGISIRFASQAVLQDVSFKLAAGGIGCLLGPSGCGKTTLLRAIAGFEPVQSGRIELAGEIVSSATKLVLPEQRRVGMVFQDFALFPHLTVADNIGFGLRKMSREERQSRVEGLLSLVSLQGFGRRYPHELSGGQQQRVALARALAPRPRLLLLDEPFASQDVELRESLAREVRAILEQEHMTALLVTHDQNEAFAMADEIGVLSAGRLQQWDTPYNLYHRPASLFVADFVGQGVLLPGKVCASGQVDTVLGLIEGVLPSEAQAGQSVGILIRPDDVEIAPDGLHQARIQSRVFRGAQYLYGLTLADGFELLCLTPSHQVMEPGQEVRFKLALAHRVILSEQIP